jgi:hypothetical protein
MNNHVPVSEDQDHESGQGLTGHTVTSTVMELPTSDLLILLQLKMHWKERFG